MVDQFKIDNEELLMDLSTLGWNFPQGNDAEMAMYFMGDFSKDMKAAVSLAAHTLSERSEMWCEGRAEWEAPMTQRQSRSARQDLLGICMARGVTTDFLMDAKKRWEKAEFSCITEQHLVIGDVYVPRHGDQLPLKMEVDLATPLAALGRENFTYQVYAQYDREQGVKACRPKINGERFVVTESLGVKFLEGFKKMRVPGNFVPSVVEYYAGEYYILSPVVAQDLTYHVVDEQGSRDVLFKRHPFMTPMELSKIADLYTHKYDGFMVWVNEKEYRVKWEPSVEVEFDGLAWECYEVSGKAFPMRPRPGKVAVSLATALGRVRSCIKAASLLGALKIRGGSIPESLLGQEVVSAQTGSKIVFLRPGGKMCLIREEGKRLDLIGGVVRPGEDMLDCAVRETMEETGVSLPRSAFHYVGATKEEGDVTIWTSHIFVAEAPDAIFNAKCVETYYVPNFEEFRISIHGRPRQVWLSRHLAYLYAMFQTWARAWEFLVVQSQGQTRALRGEDKSSSSQPKDTSSTMAKSFQVATQMRLDNMLPPVRSVPVQQWSAPTAVQAGGAVRVFPEERQQCLELLNKVFRADRSLEASEFYTRLKQSGACPFWGGNTRKVAVKWVDYLRAMGVMSVSLSEAGSGRVFTLVP